MVGRRTTLGELPRGGAELLQDLRVLQLLLQGLGLVHLLLALLHLECAHLLQLLAVLLGGLLLHEAGTSLAETRAEAGVVGLRAALLEHLQAEQSRGIGHRLLELCRVEHVLDSHGWSPQWKVGEW
ncbi:hypothetical protein D3C78_1481470 [compost metagenome]